MTATGKKRVVTSLVAGVLTGAFVSMGTAGAESPAEQGVAAGPVAARCQKLDDTLVETFRSLALEMRPHTLTMATTCLVSLEQPVPDAFSRLFPVGGAGEDGWFTIEERQGDDNRTMFYGSPASVETFTQRLRSQLPPGDRDKLERSGVRLETRLGAAIAPPR